MLDTINGYPNTPILAPGTPIDPNGTTELGLFTASATQQHALGRRCELADGRKFRYCKNGAVALTSGLMVQAKPPVDELSNEIQTGYTTSIGDTIIRVLLTTGNGVIENSLAGGTLIVQDGDGEANAYTIKGNKWITSDTVLEIELYDAIRVATAATSELTIIQNIYKDVIVTPTTITAVTIGVPNCDVAANYYFWAQTAGLCPMVVDAGETLVVGEAAGYPATPGTAGAVGVPAVTDHIWGSVVYVGAAGETALIKLNLE
jgi:hypothetical protein